MKKRDLNKRGFTLLEMLITIVVLGVCVSLLCSLFYSLYVVKDNTFADADTIDGINIIEDYIDSLFTVFDDTKNRFAVVTYANQTEIPVDIDRLPEIGSQMLVFYELQSDNSLKPVFSVYYWSATPEAIATSGGTAQDMFISVSDTSALTSFKYSLPTRINSLSFTTFNKNGEKTTATDSDKACLLKYEIGFINTKGRSVSKTVILSRKTVLE